jgi:hypothetical protein
MTDDPLSNPIRELSWRRKLSSADQARLRAWLADHPDAQLDWNSETALTKVLEQMPEFPVASNFTARVMQQVEREETREAKRASRSGWGWLWHRRWLPRVALAVVVLSAGFFAYERAVVEPRMVKEQDLRVRIAKAQSLAEMPSVASVPDVDSLKDFDAIYALDPTPVADEQLVLLFK